MVKKVYILFFIVFFGLIASEPVRAYDAKVSLASGKAAKVSYRQLNGRPYFLLRGLAESFGVQYFWSSKNAATTLLFGQGKILLSPNKPVILINGKETTLPLPPKMLSKHLYVPGEFLTGPLAELLGQEVIYQTSTASYQDKTGQKLLKNIRWYAYSSHTRMVFDLDQPLSYQIDGGESGLIKIILKDASLSSDVEEQGETEIHHDQVLQSYSAYQSDQGAIIEISTRQERAGYSHFFLKNPYRVVLDISQGEVGKTASLQPKRETTPSPQEEKMPVPPEPSPAAEESFKINQPLPLASPGALKTIVLDPGHGDFDSGAVGPTGLKEKDIVLDVALRLAQRLEKEMGLKVILTRKNDVFVPLRERTRIANRHQADLFVSIHANADKKKKARGVETFFLDLEPSDEEARSVAAFENGVINLEKNAAQEINALASLLWDLTETAHQRESSQLAEVVQNSLEKSLTVTNRGVKTAHFYVLRGALMPAILTEVGFITHRDEEKKLRDPEYRQSIADSLFKSISEYKNIYEKRMGIAQKP